MILKLFILILSLTISIRSDRYYRDDLSDFKENNFHYKNGDSIYIEDVYKSFDNRAIQPRKYNIPLNRNSRKLKCEHNHEINEDSQYTDRMDFHYPEVEFLTKNNHKDTETEEIDETFTTLPIKIAETNQPEKNRVPRLRQKKNNTPLYEYRPVRLSHVEKIQKPSVKVEKINSRYEEISADSTEAKIPNNYKEKLNDMLKNYLYELYNKKLSTTSTTTSLPINSAELDYVPEDTNSAETKFFNKNLWLSKKKKKINKFKKLLSLFTIIQFNNTQCSATSTAGSYLGVCYAETECSDLGGTAFGDCASGYGVCCVFRGTCGGTAAQNCSYFESPNYPDYYPAGGGVIIPTTSSPINPSPTPDPRWAWYFQSEVDPEIGRQSTTNTSLACIFSVYKISNAVTKMKIDFLDFELAGPTNGNCIIERLVITGQSSNNMIPTFCGYNTGQSIYVDVSKSTGPLKLSVLSTMAFKKRFRFRICQYVDTCFPDNCLQIYNGVTGTISSFNYDQAAMLNRSTPGYFNNLNYAICIRREPGYCSITYTNLMNGVEYPFNLVNFVGGVSTVAPNMAGIEVTDCPNDYIGIDSTRLCGYKFNDGSVTSNLSINAPVTDTNAGPIVIPVRTNAANVGYGFKLFYTQNICTT